MPELTDAGPALAGLNYRVPTLMTSDEVIAARIQRRGEGWTNVAEAVQWNRAVRDRPAVANESKLDTTDLDPPGVADAAIRLLPTGGTAGTA